MYILYNRLITALNEKKPDSTEFYIAKMMIWNLWELPRMSISDVAKMCAVSKSTISKFVRDIGFEDYLDFKLEAVRQGKKEIYNSNGKCNITDYIRGHGIWEYEKILSEDIRSVLFGIEEDQLNVWRWICMNTNTWQRLESVIQNLRRSICSIKCIITISFCIRQ